MFQDIFLGIVRHFAGAGAIWLIHEGIITNSQSDNFIGSVCFLGVVAWSAWEKYTRPRVINPGVKP